MKVNYDHILENSDVLPKNLAKFPIETKTKLFP